MNDMHYGYFSLNLTILGKNLMFTDVIHRVSLYHSTKGEDNFGIFFMTYQLNRDKSPFALGLLTNSKCKSGGPRLRNPNPFKTCHNNPFQTQNNRCMSKKDRESVKSFQSEQGHARLWKGKHKVNLRSGQGQQVHGGIV